jgi:integrase
MVAKSKRTKPHPDFPLFPHATGQWAKKILGRIHYFGTDRDTALKRYLDQKDDLLAGREPRGPGDNLTLRDLCNAFLTSKRNQMAAGELTSRTWSDYYRICDILLGHFGRGFAVAALRPDDFDRFRAKLAETRGPVAISNAIVRTRVVFKFAFDNEMIGRPVRFGTLFKRPAKKAMRKAKREGGSRVFEASDLRTLIDAARQPLQAMILVGINCAFGQSDLATLPLSAIDLDGGWIDFPRPKTEAVRRCALWPETVVAIREAIAHRPAARQQDDSHLTFLTQRGARWIREGTKVGSEAVNFTDYIASEFDKLSRRLGTKRRGSFYNLRHTFRTVADGSLDQPAIDCVMGHTGASMAEEYRERIDDARLRAVADYVRAWLFADRSVGSTIGNGRSN